MERKKSYLYRKFWGLILLAALLACPRFAVRAQAAQTISVSFRLIGSTKSTGKIALVDRGKAEKATGYLGAQYVTWIPTKKYALPEGSTVRDLFEKALADTGLDSVGAQNGYVTTIYAPKVCGGYALSEKANGKYSGWMYTVNGSHPDVGLDKYVLKNNDQVIWHYVNDYAAESPDWQGGLESAKDYWNKWLTAADTAPKSTSGGTTGSTGGGNATGGSTATVKKATGIKLNQSKATIYLGKTCQLKVTLTPAGAQGKVSWSSSNKKVATVNSSGKVTARKKGTAVITAKLSNGKKATCKITVKQVAVKKVKLSKTKYTLKKGKALKLKATLSPKNATGTVSWSSSNKKVAKVDKNGKVTALKKGKATITAKAGGKKAVCKITVK